MTANELINTFEQMNQNHTLIGWETLQFVAPLLRQQAQEIEALKKELALWKPFETLEQLQLGTKILTDEEISDMFKYEDSHGIIEFSRGIERFVIFRLKKASEK
jgi:hypothetical protein